MGATLQCDYPADLAQKWWEWLEELGKVSQPLQMKRFCEGVGRCLQKLPQDCSFDTLCGAFYSVIL